MKAIVSLSGGMDSATVLGKALSEDREVQCIGFTYGSKHNRWENKAAYNISVFYGVHLYFIDLTPIMRDFKSDLLLSGGSIPEGHYEEESMKRTVVPGRNIIFCSILAGLAMSHDFKEIWIGTHAGDHHIYPDCRPSFLLNMRGAILDGTDDRVILKYPFVHDTKEDILKVGLSLERPVPYHLTRSCYKNQEISCGRCGACSERLSAFKQLGIEDPIEYETRDILPKGYNG